MLNQKDFFKDLKVVELASVLAGPAVGMFFAELGANVIKVENKNGGDVTRSWKNPNESSVDEKSAYYHSVNWNKQVVYLDLTNESDSSELLKLLSNADVLITNFKNGDDKKFNLVSKDLIAKFPSLLIGEIAGYSDSAKVAYDAVLQAETGFMFLNGTRDSGPLKMPIAMIDILAAHQLKEGILVGLINRAKTNCGCIIKVNLFESAVSSLANQASNWLNNEYESPRMGSLHPNIAPYGETFQTKDGKQILLAVGSDKQFKSLCEILNAQELISDERFAINAERVKHRLELTNLIADKFKSALASYWMNLFNEHQVPAGIVNSIADVFELEAAKKKIIYQSELNGSESRRVETIAFAISDGNQNS
jgi:crotonobetainyl-CoA:carnitine CoA-transferase CaiB-like acyl-CoA transferase